jgi:hypothetical protein
MAIPHRFSVDYARKKPSTKVAIVIEPEPEAHGVEAVVARLIARYNVERRKAGEAPLDLNGIGRLRQLLVEAMDQPGSAKDADTH